MTLRQQAARGAALLAATLLSGCAGVPVGHHTFLVVGLGVVRVDRAADATGISSRSLGLTLGCRQITVGLQASYCARLPLGDVAIIERGAGADQHLSVVPLHPKEQPR